jgi:hypothetical protein
MTQNHEKEKEKQIEKKGRFIIQEVIEEKKYSTRVRHGSIKGDTKMLDTFQSFEEELENTYSSEIDWKDESLNSTIKISKKKIKRKGKAKEIQIIKKDVPSFFTIFQKEKNNLNKDLIEANFFKKDFLPNVLEYFLDIMEINYNEIESSESESDES